MVDIRKQHLPVFLSGNIAAHLIRMAAATYAALFVIQMADLLALAYVSHVGTDVDVAGLGVAMTIFFLGFVVNMGGAAAVSTIVAFSAVSDDDDQVRSRSLHAIAWLVAGGVLSTIAILFFMGAACNFLGVTGNTRDVALRYLTILAPINGLQALSMGFAATMRGLGRAKDAMLITMLGGLANLVADPLLIIYYNLGVDGAAYGVWIGRIVQVLVGIWLFRSARLIGLPSLLAMPSHFRDFIRLAIPSAVAGAAAPFGAAFLIYIIAPFGDSARTAIFIVERVSALAFGFAMSISYSVGSIVAQNFAAQEYQRALNTVRTFFVCVLGIVVCASIAISVNKNWILTLFRVPNAETSALANYYLSVCGISALGNILTNGSNVIFQNIRRASYSMYTNWARATIGLIPCWYGAFHFGSPLAAINGNVLGQILIATLALPFAYKLVSNHSS